MEQKDIWLIMLGILGWFWAIIQFFINRQNHKNDKAIEKRFEVYTAYMKKSDEIMETMRTTKMMYGISSEFMNEILGKEEEEINNSLIKFNTELLEFTKRATQPLMILNQELSNLYLICSKELLPKIQEYKKLANDFNDEYQLVLQTISPNNSQEMIEKLNIIGHDMRLLKIGELNTEILSLMRKEIGYFSKK